MELTVKPGQSWRHINGNEYEVLCIANEYSSRPAEYPMTVVYKGKNGKIWAKTMVNFLTKMTLIKDI